MLDAGIGGTAFLYGQNPEGSSVDLIRVTEQAGLIPSLAYRSGMWQRNQSLTPRWRASASYIAGGHSLKVGMDGLYYFQSRTYEGNNQSLIYRLNLGLPNQLTMQVNHFNFLNRAAGNAFYAQDQWTMGRLTLQGGLRYDMAASRWPEQIGTFEGRLRMDGIGTGGATGGVSLLIVDTGNAAEVTVTTTGGLADAEVGGPEINVVPRTGGNAFSGQTYFAGAGSAMQSDDFTQELKDAGLRSPSELNEVWDVNLALGGPIRRDKVWFYATTRTQGSYVSISDAYFNKNAGDPTKWTYEPDLTRQSETDGLWNNTSLRTTWQVSTRNKVALFWDEQNECRGCKGGGSPTVSPEADAPTDVPWMRAYQAVWTAPLSSRFLVEAAFSGMGFSYGREKEGNNRDLIRVMD